MATISTAIRVQDAMAPAFHSMNTALNIVLNSFEAMQTASGRAIDTASIQTARQELANANVVMQQVEENAKKAGEESNKMPQGFEKANNSANKLLKTLMGFSIVQKVTNLVTGQVSSAMNRLDTLNNYPKVMSNLGIDKAQANASKQMLVDGLQGLPTTLDDAVSSVQNFTSVNGNVNKSTKMFLALNNAILAGGGSTQMQQSALEQLSQSYAKGKPDMMEWRTAMTAMPAQMRQVAKAMGYADANKLGEKLRAGKVSMNDFMNTFIQLNEKGTAEFQSFEQQARNATGGFATSIANMKSAVTRGITSIITSINNGLEKAGLPTIQTMIQNVGSAIETGLNKIGDIISKIIQILSPVFSAIQSIYNFIKDNWSIIEPIIQAIIVVLGIYYTYTLLAKVGTDMLRFAFKALTNPMFWVMTIIIAIVAILIYLWKTNDNVAYGILYAWDALRLGVMMLKLGVQVAFYAIVVAGLYMYQGILGIKMGLQTAFYMMKLGALALQLGFEGVCQGIVNAFVWMYNGIVKLLNALGGKFETMEYADFTSKTVNSINDTMSEYVNAVSETYGQMEDTNANIAKYQAKLNDVMNNGSMEIVSKAQEFNTTRNARVANRNGALNNMANGAQSAMQNAIGATISSDLSNIAENTGGIKNKLDVTEEDLQYLRDIAERETINRFTTAEIKVEMTNNNNVNSGLDLDGIVDSLGQKLEERLEVVAEGVYI